MGKRVLAAMSGGVDSSVSAALLKEQGYEVIGAMMRFWPDNKQEDCFETCCSPDAAYEARRVADILGIPFYLLDYREEFQEKIIGPFIAGYRAGQTPNPCVNCNTRVKFDSLLRKARMLGCDYVATGHYVINREGGLYRGDPRKDQTYFLWGTPKEAIPHMLFPVGHLEKPQVRALAERFGLPTAKKPESQNICFVQGDLREFLARHIETRPGPLIDLETGAQIGEHSGAQLYTVGQRKGLGLWKSHPRALRGANRRGPQRGGGGPPGGLHVGRVGGPGGQPALGAGGAARTAGGAGALPHPAGAGSSGGDNPRPVLAPV